MASVVSECGRPQASEKPTAERTAKELEQAVTAGALHTAAAERHSRPAPRPAPENTTQHPLVQALVTASRFVGLTARDLDVAETLLSTGGQAGSSQLPTIAAAAGLAATPCVRRRRALKAHECPALLCLKDGRTALVLSPTEPVLLWQAVSSNGETDIASDGAARPESHPPQSLRQLLKAGADVHCLTAMGQSKAAKTTTARDHVSVHRYIMSGNWGLLIQAIFATVAINLLGLAIPLFTMNVYDRVLPNNAITTLTALGVGAAIALIFDFTIKSLRTVLIDTAARRSDVHLSATVMSRILGAETNAMGQPVGVQMNSAREIETLREFYTSATLTVFGDLPFAILFVGVIAIIGGPLALIPLAAIPIIGLLAILSQWPLRRMMAESFQHLANKNAVLCESLQGLETIKAAGATHWISRKWEASVVDQLRLSGSIRFFSSLAPNIAGIGQGLSAIAMIVFGVALVNDGVISAGAVIASVMLLSRAMSPIAQVAALCGRMQQVAIARNAVEQLISAPQEQARSLDAVSPRIDGSVTFRDVSFAYHPESPAVLSGVNLKFAAGEKVGIIGAMGCGKSTLLKMLMRLHLPNTGTVLVDGIGVGAIQPAALRRQLGYMGQDSTLFRGSLRDNIVMGRLGIGDDELMAAAKASAAAEWIGTLAHGFDTIIGEGGAGLSGGQKRSLQLARALAGNPAILLLDEPTNEMDGRTERRVIDGLKTTIQNKTVLLVTHKPAALDLVDRLVVLEKGEIVANGPKAQVLAELKKRNAEGAQQRGREQAEMGVTIKAPPATSQPKGLDIQINPVRNAMALSG
ncbi:MAG: ATP-binding cassette domain-containing protein [Pseudomonadota bacterium]